MPMATGVVYNSIAVSVHFCGVLPNFTPFWTIVNKEKPLGTRFYALHSANYLFEFILNNMLTGSYPY